MPLNSLVHTASSFALLLEQIECRHAGRQMTVDDALAMTLDLLATLQQQQKSIFIIGNGGSAAVATHIHTDFVNKCAIRAHVLHEPSLLTCLSNDFGYEQAYARSAALYIDSGDLLFAISSSGCSVNILAAVQSAQERGALVITFSGFERKNPLSQLGKINFWSPSSDYGAVEISHLFLLHYLADALACIRGQRTEDRGQKKTSHTESDHD